MRITELSKPGVESATTSKLETKPEVKTKKSKRPSDKIPPESTALKANMVLFVSLGLAVKNGLRSTLANTPADAIHPLGNKWSPND